MRRFIIILRASQKIEAPDERNGRDAHVIGTLQKFINEERIEYQGWHYDRDGDVDNGFDDAEKVFEDETYFEVRGEFDVEFTDPLSVLPQVTEALTKYSAHVSNYHEYGGNPFTKTIIEITLT